MKVVSESSEDTPVNVVGKSSEFELMETVGESYAVDQEGNKDLPSPH